MKFFTSFMERMVIDGSGNVGIGTSFPNANLQVSGRFIAGDIYNTATGINAAAIG
jgi:hypothetical protein